MRKLVKRYEFVLSSDHMERTIGESLTIPGEVLSLTEILERHRRGQRIPGTINREVMFSTEAGNFDDPDMESVKRMDFSDKHLMSEDLKLAVAGKRKAVADAKAAIKAKEAAEKAAKRARIEAKKAGEKPAS